MASPSNRPLRIAFGSICTKQWIAGCHYLKNLFIALKGIDENPELVLYGEAINESEEILDRYIEQRLESPINRLKPLDLVFRVERRFGIPLGMGQALSFFLRKHRIDVMFTQVDQGPSFNVPLLVWLTDFQHIHLPEMFSSTEIGLRNRVYGRTAKRADRIILSSQDAFNDFRRFVPEHAHKGKVLNFVANISHSVYDTDPKPICEHYHLPERFIYLPNQFWKHKNHQLVLEALSRLKAKNVAVTVACTGNTEDHRNPDHFSNLRSTIEHLGLRDEFIILGMIPHEHIFQLIRQSLAVLQPSLFEGWSTSVEEVKSIGKRIILSNLAVHREQNPPLSLFFDPYDPEALADCLLKTVEEAQPGPDRLMELRAREQLPHRTRVFGEAFMRIVREIL